MRNITQTIGVLLTSTVFFAALLSVGIAAETDVIRIGYTAPFTGAAAEYGNNGWRGILLALEDINKKGISISHKKDAH